MKPLKPYTLMQLLLICAFLQFATSAHATTKPLKIVTTTGMIGDIVKNVVQDKAEVTTLMGSGIDPHLYKPTRSDIATLTSADIVFYNGLLLEGKMTDALIRVATSGKPVFAVTDLLDQQYLLEPPEFAGHFDPHVWMDPNAWKQAVTVVSEKLSLVDSVNSEFYKKNSASYAAELDRLDNYARGALQSVPSESRLLVTAHDAFNYLGKRYGFEVVGIQGISTESEAGVKDIERIVNLLVERNVKAVFVESTVSERNIRALIEGAKARGHSVKIGGKLFSDAMGVPNTYEGTYIGMIDHNVTAIAVALGGTVPPSGLNNKLLQN